MAPPSRQAVVERLAEYRGPRDGAALWALVCDLSLYGASLAGMVMAGNAWVVAVLAVVNAAAIGRLFILGHDACHGSGYRRRWMNQLLGRLAFLPSLTPFSGWELGHNTLHHGFTNLRGKDYVYAPLTRAEYAALPRWRRVLERAYRHPLGPGLCYAVEVWWKRLLFPREGARRWVYVWDSMLVAGYMGGLAAAVWWAGGDALWAVVVPQVLWLNLMGFATYQHHTHPDVVWFDDRRRWDPLMAQIENTVHVEFPRPLGWLLRNIMEHGAHHVDVKIPLFRLPEAQVALEEMFPEQVPVERFRWRTYWANCRRCQLYDYRGQRWLNFDL